MPILQIHDRQRSQRAVVDPRHVLTLLGERALTASWRISGVSRFGEDPMIVGDEAADRLEALALSQAFIPETLLNDLVQQTVQIIWGEFNAYEEGEAVPWMVVQAIDSTWCEVETDDASVLDLVCQSFADVRTPV